MQVEEAELSYSLEVILVDFLTGVVAIATVVPTALLVRGFSFFTPWLIAGPLVMLTAGLLRSRSEGIIWIKCVVICVAPLYPLP